jgi:predicted O-methyltransferase YrrM
MRALPAGRFRAVEIGCAVAPDGSTPLIAEWAAAHPPARFFSVDKSRERVDAAAALVRPCREEDVRVLFVVGHSLQVLPRVLSELDGVDLAYVDGGADPAVCLREFELLRAALAPGGLIVVDDAGPMAPTLAHPGPRPHGKATRILPALAESERVVVQAGEHKMLVAGDAAALAAFGGGR